MPYPKEPSMRTKSATTRGELAHKVAQDFADYVNVSGLSYETITDIRGAAHAAVAEFDRRVAEPYEDSKLADGGADPYARLAHEAINQRSRSLAGALAAKLRRH